MKSVVVAIAAFAVSASSLTAQELHNLKVNVFAPVGVAIQTRDDFTARMTMRVLDPSGTLLGTRRRRESTETVYTDRRLDSTRAERRYEIARKSDEEGVTRLPKEGSTLTFRLEPSVTLLAGHATLDAKTIEDIRGDLDEAAKMSRKNFCMPSRAVAEGAEWDVARADADLCFNPFGGNAGGAASARGKLVDVYEVDGKAWANVTFRATVPVDRLGDLDLDPGAKMDAAFDLHFPVDANGSSVGHVRYTGTVTGESAPEGPSKPKMKLSVEVTGTSTTTVK